MAIYRLSVKTIGRGDGRSAVACAAYRAGEALYDESSEQLFDYSRRREETEAFVAAPEGAPAWAEDRERLWNEVERAERRRDARLAREVLLALPREVPVARQRELVEGYVRWAFVRHGMVADVSIHLGTPEDRGNPHAHVMLTTRRVGPEGFGKKERDWDKKGELGGWRKAWQGHANRALEREGSRERIDHRSYAARGIDREPGLHEGVAVRRLEERGVRTRVGDRNREIGRRNAERGSPSRKPAVGREPERDPF